MDNSSKFLAVNTSTSGSEDNSKGFTFRPDPRAIPARQDERVTSPIARGSSVRASPFHITSEAVDTVLPVSPSPVALISAHRPPNRAVISPSAPSDSPSRLARDSIERTRAYSHSWTNSESGPKHAWTTSDAQDDTRLVESLQHELSSGTHEDSDEMDVDEDRADSPRSSALDPSSSTNTTQLHGVKESRDAPKRRFTTRTKTGCHTCRRRKKKCDETKPVCNNCTKGGFKCLGYGERRFISPPLVPGPAQTRESYASDQAREHYQAPFRNGPPTWTDPRRTQHHAQTNETPAPTEARPRDAWGSERIQPHAQTYSTALQQGSGHAPRALVHQPHQGHQTTTWPSQPQQSQTTSQIVTIRPQDDPGTAFPGPPSQSDARTLQRRKMVAGLPYRHYMDPLLTEDRRQCRLALENWHDALRPSRTTTEEESSRLFKAIVMPDYRRRSPPDGKPAGHIGRQVIVEAPFSCEYGYNISLGDGVTIQSGCFIQDPCKVTIGANTNVGPNVKIYGMVMPTDARARGGSGSLGIGAPITIEEHCYIGASVIIMPGVTIKRGSFIDAGTLVTKDVPANVQYGGNPAQVLRGITVPGGHGKHDPRSHEDDDLAALLMTDRT